MRVNLAQGEAVQQQQLILAVICPQVVIATTFAIAFHKSPISQFKL
ncbi:MAG: hypothetical protein F6J96_31630 [Symploca sp. SIO1C2]|nr:hypothetical protein [Symploca sp. SIO1C2]